MRPILPLLILALAAPLPALADGLTVPVDQSRRLPIRGAAANVVVGNTAIADVRAVDSQTLMVVGKKQGVTNIVVLDAAGRTLFSDEVIVSASAGNMVTVYRGAQPQEYACSPYCQSTGGDSLAAPAPFLPIVTTAAAPATETVTAPAPAPDVGR